MSESFSPPIPLPLDAEHPVRDGVVWFDSDSSRKTTAALALVGGRICAINEQGERREAAVRDMEISSRLGNSPRQLVFPDGTAIVADDNDAIESLLRRAGGKPPFLHRLESAWKAALLTTVAAAALLYAALSAGIPAAADFAAHRVSHERLAQISGRVYQQLLEHDLLSDSKLPTAEQERVRRLFAEVSASWENDHRYRVRTHRLMLGGVSVPNAFALPDGLVVVTDELAKSLNDDEIRAVLAHEIGHVELRHGMRSLLAAAGTGLYLTMLGDVSFLLSGGAVLLEWKYSRAHEEEADCFAYRYLRERDMNGGLVGTALQKMESSMNAAFKEEDEDGEQPSEVAAKEENTKFWQNVLQSLSTHPPTAARLNLGKSCAA